MTPPIAYRRVDRARIIPTLELSVVGSGTGSNRTVVAIDVSSPCSMAVVRSTTIPADLASRANGASAAASAAIDGNRAARSFSRQRRTTVCSPRGIRGCIGGGGSVAARSTVAENVSAANG